jgi:hypothetical protein
MRRVNGTIYIHPIAILPYGKNKEEEARRPTTSKLGVGTLKGNSTVKEVYYEPTPP